MKQASMTFRVMSSNGIRMVDACGGLKDDTTIGVTQLLQNVRAMILEQSEKYYHEHPECIELCNMVVKDV